MPTEHPTFGDPVEVVVSPSLVPRLRDAALGLVAIASENAREGADWHRQGRDRTRLDHDDLPRAETAARLWDQVRCGDGPLTVGGRHDDLGILVRQALAMAVEELAREVEGLDMSAPGVRLLAGEIGELARVYADAGLPRGGC